MGGFGSGGHNRRYSLCVERMKRLTVSSISKDDLVPSDIPYVFEVSWQLEEELYTQRILLQYESRHFGGGQAYFLCPNCRRRCTWLALRWSMHLCRTCANLPYITQRQREIERMRGRLEKLYRKLKCDWEVNILSPCLPDRPRGMHNSTYVRLVAEFEEIEEKLESAVLRKIESLGKRSKNRKRRPATLRQSRQ